MPAARAEGMGDVDREKGLLLLLKRPEGDGG